MDSLSGARVFVAGHNGMVGKSLCRRLTSSGCHLLTAPRAQLDLREQADVRAWFDRNRPDVVFLAAAPVGNAVYNATYPVEVMAGNLSIPLNVLEAAQRSRVGKVVLVASSAIYPNDLDHALTEDRILSGPPDSGVVDYAVAKIAAIRLCVAYRAQFGCDFVAVVPNNLYGPGDEFAPGRSRVVAALMARLHEAKDSGAQSVEVWGDGTQRRELVFVDDLADAMLFLVTSKLTQSWVNVGSGQEVTIRHLAETIRDIVGFKGRLTFNAEKPSGTARKLLDSSLLNAAGWGVKTSLASGLEQTYRWYLANVAGQTSPMEKA